MMITRGSHDRYPEVK